MMALDLFSVQIIGVLRNLGAKMLLRLIVTTVVGHIIYTEHLAAWGTGIGSWTWAVAGAVALVITDALTTFIVGELKAERARNLGAVASIEQAGRAQILQEELAKAGYMKNPQNGQIVQIPGAHMPVADNGPG